MAKASAAAIGGALVAVLAALPSTASAQGAAAPSGGATSVASAQSGLTERLTVQGVVAHRNTNTQSVDWSGMVVPQLSLLVLGSRAQLQASYVLAATAHTTMAANVANSVSVGSSFDISKRTVLRLSAGAGHTAISNALVAAPPSGAPTGAVPLVSGQLVTATVGEVASYDVSPRVRLSETVDVLYVTNVGAALAMEGYSATGVATADRTWKRDAVGVDFRAGYARNQMDPFPRQRLVPLAVTPHWRHDISASLTSYVAAGPLVILSPDSGTSPYVGPFVLASLHYLLGVATMNLTGSVGPVANTLTGQLNYAEQVTLRAMAPLWPARGVSGSATCTYTHGVTVVGRAGAATPPSFDIVLADVGVGWTVHPKVELFARYQFLDQILGDTGPTSTPAAIRNAIIVGVMLSSRPDFAVVPTTLPHRVDRSDGASVDRQPTQQPDGAPTDDGEPAEPSPLGGPVGPSQPPRPGRAGQPTEPALFGPAGQPAQPAQPAQSGDPGR